MINLRKSQTEVHKRNKLKIIEHKQLKANQKDDNQNDEILIIGCSQAKYSVINKVRNNIILRSTMRMNKVSLTKITPTKLHKEK